jgi:hypothetical protein
MSFANFIRENSGGIHQVEGRLEMAKDWNCFWKFFIFENFSTWAGRPWELGHLKNLCVFLPSLKCAFKPSIIIFSAPSSPHLLSSAPLSPWPSKVVRFLTLPLFWVCLRALTSSERAFEPSLHFERAFEPSLPFKRALEPSLPFKRALEPSLFSRACLWALTSLRACLWALASSRACFGALASFRARLRAFNHPFECAFEPSFSFFFFLLG